jgi:hypothetical protein
MDEQKDRNDVAYGTAIGDVPVHRRPLWQRQSAASGGMPASLLSGLYEMSKANRGNPN